MTHWQFFAAGFATWAVLGLSLSAQPDHSVRGWRKYATYAALGVGFVLTHIGLVH